MKSLTKLAAVGALATPLAAHAMGAFTIGNEDIRLDGGITGAYIAESDTGSTKQDTIQVTDFILQFEREAEPGGVGFTSGVGSLVPPYLGMRGLNSNGVGQTSSNLGGGVISGPFRLYYGWVRVMPIEHLAIDVGQLESHVGYETDLTYQNRNIMLGLVRGSQPVFYGGARVSWWVDGIGLYAEIDKDAETMLSLDPQHTVLGPGFSDTTANALGFGVEGKVSGINGEFNFFSVQNNTRIFDVVAETQVMGIDVAANVDFIMESDALQNEIQTFYPTFDTSAFGAAFYATFHVKGKFTVPVRFEYVNGGNSGLYGLGYPGDIQSNSPSLSNAAMSITVTPTYNFSAHTFVRAEVSFTTLDQAKAKSLVGFKDTAGQPTDSNTVFVMQAGTRF